MSSLPPYNPAPGRRLVWLLNRDGVAHALLACGPELESAATGWVDDEARRDDLAAQVSGAAWRLLPADAAELEGVAREIRGAAGSSIAVAAEAILHPLLCVLLDLPADRARFRFIPGKVTTAQLLDDRAVIRHLNQGAI